MSEAKLKAQSEPSRQIISNLIFDAKLRFALLVYNYRQGLIALKTNQNKFSGT